MKIQEVILTEYEGTLSGTPAGVQSAGNVPGAGLNTLGGSSNNSPQDPNAPSPQQVSGSSMLPTAVTAAVAIAAYKKLMKPAKPGTLPTTSPAAYRSPEARVAYSAEVRRAAAETDLKTSKALLAAKTDAYNKLIASRKADLAARRAPTYSNQLIQDANRELKTITTRISTLERTEIPRLNLEVSSAVKAIKNPIKRAGASIVVSNAQKAAIEAKYMASWSWWFKKLLSVLGVITPLYQLYAEYERINALNITPQEKSSAKSQAWGVFEAQLGTLVVARMAEVRLVAGVVKAIQIGAGVAGGVFSGGASIVASLVGAAATDALVTWLGTDTGRKFLVENIGWAIQHGGEFAQGFWTALSDVAKGISGQPAS